MLTQAPQSGPLRRGPITYTLAYVIVGSVVNSLLLKAYFAGRAGRYRFTQPRPSSRGRVAVAGLDPIRILVTGAGLATGYGVTHHEQTLAGPLAADIAHATGRGVIIDIRSSPLLPARQAIAAIGVDGAHGYHAAIFTPCYLEAPFAPGAGMSRHGTAIQLHLLDTGGPGLQLLMLGIPRPSRYSRLNVAAVEAATITNQAMRRNTHTDPRAQYLAPPDFESLALERPFDEHYYAQVGHDAATSLLHAMHLSPPEHSGP